MPTMSKRALAASIALMAAAPGAAEAHGPNHASGLDPANVPAFGPTTGGSVFDRPLAAAAAGPEPVTVATILSVSDFHGRLNPEPFRVDLKGEKFGGAAYLQTHLEQRAALSPTPPFLVTQGDAVGATQPVSGLLGDRPTIDVMNAMGFDADTLGNHNFDSGVARMRNLARDADFPYVVSNLDPTGQRLPWTKRWAIWEVDGVRIGVVGAINQDAPDLLNPGLMGDVKILPAAGALNAAAAELRSRGVRTIVALVHYGAEPTQAGEDGTKGPLIDLAKSLKGVDLVLGDHTYWQVNQPVVADDNNVVWVVQSVPNGATFSEAKLTISKLDGEALAVTADQFPVKPAEVAADPEIAALVQRYNDQVEPVVTERIATSTEPMPINDAMSESLQGNVVTDALRWSTGAQLALFNSGGLRAGLTDGENCAGGGLGPCTITRGDVYGMLPFNNRTALVSVTGRELKTMLENGVSAMPTPAAPFPQISGFSFHWRQLEAAQARVVSAALADGTPIAFDDSTSYTLATNDFVAFGGDRYPDFTGRLTFGNPVEDDVIAYLKAQPEPFDPPGPPVDEPRIVRQLP